MLELKIAITAADLAAAINNLAAALDGKNAKTAAKPSAPDRKTAPVIPTPAVQPQTPAVPVIPQIPAVPVNPIPAPVIPQIAVPAITPTTANPPCAPATTVPVQAAVPTAAPQYTIDMLANAGAALLDAGKMDQLMQLLNRFGVASLTELSPDNYGAVAGELRAMGAAI